MKNKSIIIFGQQESLYNPVPAIERAKQLITDIKTQLIPQAGHELPGSKPDIIDKKILEFLKADHEVNL